MTPAPSRQPGDGPESYARAVGRVACAQVIYARAERLAAQEAKLAAKSGAGKAGAASTPRAGGRRGATDINPSTVFASDSVADALADVAAAFIVHVGSRSAARAALAGRTSAALTDVLAVLNDASSFTQSQTKDLARYAVLEEIQFPTAVPAFPVPVSRAEARMVGDAKYVAPDPVDGNTVSEGGEPRADAASMPWIEPWMPPLPPRRTYMATPGVVTDAGKASSAGPDRATVSRQRRQVEQSLARLKEKEQSEGSGATEVVKASARLGHVPATHALAQNPFLAPPKIGSAKVIDESKSGRPGRDVTEPLTSAIVEGDGDGGLRDSNAAGDGNDPKRARVSRILNEGLGVGGAGEKDKKPAAKASPTKPAKKEDDEMDVEPG